MVIENVTAMKKQFFLLSFLLSLSIVTFGQDATKFSVRISTDSVLMGNTFQVSFSLENAQGNNFEAPDLALYFDVVSGPNLSTSMQFINGQMSQSTTYTYYLRPREEGVFFIEPASVETPDNYLETSPIEVLVVPNPDGVQQQMTPQQPFGRFDMGMPGQDRLGGFNSLEDMRKQMEQFFQGNDFFNGMGSPFDMPMDSLFFQMPLGDNFFQMQPMNPDSLWKQMPEEWKKLLPKDADPKKKKRKIYKM
jgi:hypothetical protein